MCMCLGQSGVGCGWYEWVREFGLGLIKGSVGGYVCVLVAVVWVVLGEVGGGFGQVLEVLGGVMYGCVVSLDSVCRWHVQVSAYCAS